MLENYGCRVFFVNSPVDTFNRAETLKGLQKAFHVQRSEICTNLKSVCVLQKKNQTSLGK